MLHRDPKIWGDNPEAFDPDRFTPEAEQDRPPNAYKPFGTGQRACIGRQFAMLEATLVLGMILQRFELVDHTNYELKIKQTLTIKPADFHIKVRPRTNRPLRQRARAATGRRPAGRTRNRAGRGGAGQHPASGPLWLQPGHGRRLAHQIADDGRTHGFATTIASPRRLRGQAAEGRGRGDNLLLLQRHPAGQRGSVSSTGCATIPSARMR